MNIMNKKIVLLINLLLLTFYCYGQVCSKSYGTWLKIYPLSASQFEQNEGINGTFTFDHALENITHFMFLPEDHIKCDRDDVSNFIITKYFQTKKWDEIIWEKRDVVKIQYMNDHVLVNGNRPYEKYFSVLNTKGQKEKTYENTKLKYKRDEQGRVFMVFVYYYNELIRLYKYTYENSDFTDKITKIEQFSHEGERFETTEFIYDGNNLINAIWFNSDKRINMRFEYDNNNNPISLYNSTVDKIHNKNDVIEYKLSYEYSDGKISSCICRWGSNPDQCEQWELKYDDRGNWTEMIIPTSGTKWIREITYK